MADLYDPAYVLAPIADGNAIRGDMVGPTPSPLPPLDTSGMIMDNEQVPEFARSWADPIEQGGLGLTARATPAQPSQGIDWRGIGLGLQAAGAGATGGTPWYLQERQIGLQEQQLQVQRQQTAAKMAELFSQKQQHDENKILDIWKNSQLTLAQKKKMSEELGRSTGNALGVNLAKMSNDELVAKAELYQKYLPPGKYEELRGILQTPNADLSPVESWTKWAEDFHKVTVESQAKSDRFAHLLQQHQKTPLDPNSAEFDEFREMVRDRTKRQEEAAKLNLEIQSLSADLSKKTGKPEEAYSVRGKEGEIITGIYDPATGKTTERVGMPLQRVQTQDITAATKTKNAEILDQGENVLGIIQQYRNVLRPENVGLLGDLRGLVFGAGQQSDAFGQLLKGQANAVVDQLGQSGGTVSVSNFFDPKLSKSELLGNILTYQLAFINSPDGRVSNDDFKIAKQSLGIDKLLTGAGDISAKVDALEEVVRRRMGIASRRLGAEQTKPPKYKTIEEYKKARGIK